MYSILPAIVALLFLGCGFYALWKRGFNRITGSFFLLCITTFLWQGTWAVLFHTNSAAAALVLVKVGYFFILFLPTAVYHFLAEITGRSSERRYVYLSYGLAGILAVFLLTSDLFVSGYYAYFWGYYPKAGMLHPVHVAQTTLVVTRGLYITYVAQKTASDYMQMRLRLCVAGLLVYLFAAVDYLCNYGLEFYPPGLIFITISLGFLTIAIVKYDLFNPMALAGSLAHEIRTPLASIRNQAVGISMHLPTLLEGYRLAVKNKLIDPRISDGHLEMLGDISGRITEEVRKSNTIIDTMLASSSLEDPRTLVFERYFITACVTEAIDRYPFEAGEREKVFIEIAKDFQFRGSDTLLVLVLFNLLKNSLYSLHAAGKGNIRISAVSDHGRHTLRITDTGSGIPKSALPHIFAPFFSTKHTAAGAGMGLSFCKKAMEAFGGTIRCDSVEGEFTTFALEFPTA
jgi:two-component system CAI-1 autoinducer sensor kinase/phosphatase CqsS